MPLTFTWDSRKAARNERKHRITFEEASTIFRDEQEVMISDPEHSAKEERFVSLGVSDQGRLLTVSYTESGEAIRIISARLATSSEHLEYVNGT
jgi:hypothetical protein